jgi:hypothetical protein
MPNDNEPPDEMQELTEEQMRRAIQPHRIVHRLAARFGTSAFDIDWDHVVLVDDDLWEHFGSHEEVVAALRALVDASKHVRKAG